VKTIELIILMAITLCSSSFAVGEKTIESKDTAQHVGETAVVTGTIAEVRHCESGDIILYFGAKYPKEEFQFCIPKDKVIDGLNMDNYERKEIFVRGKIEVHNGKPEIKLDNVRYATATGLEKPHTLENISNADLIWIFDFTGESPRIMPWTSTFQWRSYLAAKQRTLARNIIHLSDHEERVIIEGLVNALGDKHRWIAAHLLCMVFAGGSYSMTDTSYGGLSFSFDHADKLRIDDKQRWELQKQWKERFEMIR